MSSSKITRAGALWALQPEQCASVAQGGAVRGTDWQLARPEDDESALKLTAAEKRAFVICVPGVPVQKFKYYKFFVE